MILLVIAVVATSLFLICQVIYTREIKYKALKNIPGPPSSYFFGNIFDLNKNIHELFEGFISINKTHGRLVKIWPNPMRPLVVVTDARFIEKILATNSHLMKSSLYENLEPFLGHSLVTAGVDTWKRDRKLANSAFQPKLFNEYIHAFEFHGNKLITILKKQNKEVIDLPTFVDLYVLDVICETMTNIRTNYQETSDDGYLEARSTYLTIFMNRAYSYLKRPNLFFSLTDEYKTHKRCINKLHEFAQNILDTRRKSRKIEEQNKMESSISRTVLDLFIDAEVPEHELVNHVNMFIVAGHDTPGSTIAFALYEMAQNSKIQTKVLDESISILGKNPNAIVTVQDMQQMTYLEAVIKETLRLHTTIPAVERLLEEDITIDGITIPKDTEVSIAIYSVHHDEEYFPNPNNFNPDRFLSENLDHVKNYFVPFAKGPRDCIGKTMAMLLMKSVITKVVRNFELSSVPHKIKYTSEFVLKSHNGLPVRLKPRNIE